MKAFYNTQTERWEVLHDIYPITVKHRSRSEAEAMLEALARRYEAIRANREAEV